MTTIENTTRSSENTITRREMLQSVAVTAAATVLYSPSAMGAEDPSDLRSLISRQQEAFAASNMGWDKRDDLKEAFREKSNRSFSCRSASPPMAVLPTARASLLSSVKLVSGRKSRRPTKNSAGSSAQSGRQYQCRASLLQPSKP